MESTKISELGWSPSVTFEVSCDEGSRPGAFWTDGLQPETLNFPKPETFLNPTYIVRIGKVVFQFCEACRIQGSPSETIEASNDQ